VPGRRCFRNSLGCICSQLSCCCPRVTWYTEDRRSRLLSLTCLNTFRLRTLGTRCFQQRRIRTCLPRILGMVRQQVRSSPRCTCSPPSSHFELARNCLGGTGYKRSRPLRCCRIRCHKKRNCWSHSKACRSLGRMRCTVLRQTPKSPHCTHNPEDGSFGSGRSYAQDTQSSSPRPRRPPARTQPRRLAGCN